MLMMQNEFLESRKGRRTTVWTDGSQMDDGNMGCAVVWRIAEGEMEKWRRLEFGGTIGNWRRGIRCRAICNTQGRMETYQ
jgi:hypothetical protein